QHVLQRGQLGEQVEALEDEPDARVTQRRKPRVGEAAQPLAQDLHLSLVGAVQTAQDVEQRALAGPALPLDGDELTCLDGEVQPAPQVLRRSPRLPGWIALAQRAQLDGAHGFPGAMATSTCAETPCAPGNAAAVRRSGASGS